MVGGHTGPPRLSEAGKTIPLCKCSWYKLFLCMYVGEVEDVEYECNVLNGMHVGEVGDI